MRIQLAFMAMALSFFSRFSLAQKLLSQNQPNRLFHSGKLLFEHGELGAAEKQFQDFLHITPNFNISTPEAEYYLALSSLELYHADAQRHVEKLLQKPSQNLWKPIMYGDVARFFCNKKDYKKAISYFEKVDFSTLDKEFYISGRFYWGYSLFNLRKLDEALEQFDHVKFLNNRFGPVSSYYAGFIKLIHGDYDGALEDLKRAEENEFYADIVPYLIASVYYKKHEFGTLASYLKALKNRDFTNKNEITLLGAELFFQQKRYTKALEGYKHYLGLHKTPATKALLLKAGFSAYLAKQDSLAIAYLKVSATSSDSIGFYSSYYLGALYLKKGYNLLALNAFSQSEKGTSHPLLKRESTYQKAKLLYNMGRFDEAVNVLEKFIRNYPSSDHLSEGKNILSKAYLNVLNYDKAMAYIDSLSTRTPDLNRVYQQATWLKGSELFNKEDYTRAIEFFEKSLQYPMDKAIAAKVSFWIGEAYSIGKKYKPAIMHYLHAISLDKYVDNPLITKIRYGLGYAFFNLKRYERALYNFKEVLNDHEDNHNYFDALLRLSDCYYVMKSYGKALSGYQKYVAMRGTEQDYALLQTGVILGVQQQHDRALKALNRVIEEHPRSLVMDEVLFQKTQINFELGNYASAVEGYTGLIVKHPTSSFVPYAYMRRAASYYNLKKYNKTVADYLSILRKYPLHPVAKNVLLPLQEALNLLGRTTEFQSYLSRYKQANPNKKDIEAIEFETAQNLYFHQNYSHTIKSFENYITNYPQSPRLMEARYYQAESHYRLGEHDKAIKIYEQVVTDPTFLSLNRAVARLAELNYNMKNYRKAISNFSQLEGIADTRKEKIKAWLGMMESYFMIAVYDSSNIYAYHILEKEGVDIGAKNRASLFLGKSAMAEKKYEVAQDEFLNTINTAQDKYGAEAKYLLGKTFFLMGDHKQCYETLIELNSDFSSYTIWVGKSFLLLSDNFVATGDVFQAKGTLNSLIDGDFPLQDIKREAQQKLRAIGRGNAMQKGSSSQDSLSQPHDQK